MGEICFPVAVRCFHRGGEIKEFKSSPIWHIVYTSMGLEMSHSPPQSAGKCYVLYSRMC